MRLTKKIRHQIYVETLKFMKHYTKTYENVGAGHTLGLCYYLTTTVASRSNKFRDYGIEPYKNMDRLPEIAKHKPIGNDVNVNWFPNDKIGFDARMNILEQAIKDTA